MYKIEKLELESIKNNYEKIIFFLKESYESDFKDSEITHEYLETKYKSMSKFSEEENVLILGVWFKDELIGYLWSFYRDVVTEKIGHLNQIYIEKKHRGKGLAKELMKKMEEFMELNKINSIDLNVTLEKENVISFYKKLGFQTERLYMKKK